MKKILILFAFLAMSGSAFSQTTLYTTGTTHVIASSFGAAALADSIHTFGVVDMRNGTAFCDSIQIYVEAGDSLKIRYFVVPVEDIGDEAVADSTAGCQIAGGVAEGATQMTAGVQHLVPWHNILGAITTHKAGAKAFRIYGRVYAVGSELRGTTKTFKTTVKRFY